MYDWREEKKHATRKMRSLLCLSIDIIGRRWDDEESSSWVGRTSVHPYMHGGSKEKAQKIEEILELHFDYQNITNMCLLVLILKYYRINTLQLYNKNSISISLNETVLLHEPMNL